MFCMRPYHHIHASRARSHQNGKLLGLNEANEHNVSYTNNSKIWATSVAAILFAVSKSISMADTLHSIHKRVHTLYSQNLEAAKEMRNDDRAEQVA